MAQRATRKATGPAPGEGSAPIAQTTTLALPQVSDAGAAAALKESLSPLVLQGAPIRLAGGDVERITTACMQVLLAADRALSAQHAGLVLSEASAPMRQAFAELGLSAELERWMAAHG